MIRHPAFLLFLGIILVSCGGGGDGGSTAPPPPTVATSVASAIAATSATLNGTVNPNGLATEAWFEWGTSPILATYDNTAKQPFVAGTAIQSVVASLSGLNFGTTYYFRIVASNSSGVTKGTIANFSTSASTPTVTTGSASAITTTTATLNGTVNPNGLVTDAWFEWGQSPTLASFFTTASKPIGSGSAVVPTNEAISGLAFGGTFYFRAAASNPSGTQRGAIQSFSTLNPPPVANAGPDNTVIQGQTATLNGSGSSTPSGTITSYLWQQVAGTTVTLSSNTAVSPTFTAPTVTPVGAVLRFQLTVTDSRSLTASDNVDITVSWGPSATTGTASSITTTAATLNGTVNPNGISTEAWFEYGTDNTLSSFVEMLPHQVKGSGTTDQTVSFRPTTLNPWQTYYFRMVASPTADPNRKTRGAIQKFPTGEYYVAVGDSITAGSHDNIPSDDTSLDLRNTGGGFEPILNNLLTAANGYPHTVVNEGISGDTSEEGVVLISTPGPNNPLTKNPSANHVLVMYGTNDANIGNGPVTKATYKANMQAIITAIINAGKKPYLAKVPYVDSTNPMFPAGESFSNVAIQQYNQAIDELVADPLNGISVVPPDFYAWFQSHTSQLADGIHPNGTGYQSMANRWFAVLP